MRVERCHDLRLCAAILDRSTLTEQAARSRPISASRLAGARSRRGGRRTRGDDRAVGRDAVRSRRLHAIQATRCAARSTTPTGEAPTAAPRVRRRRDASSLSHESSSVSRRWSPRAPIRGRCACCSPRSRRARSSAPRCTPRVFRGIARCTSGCSTTRSVPRPKPGFKPARVEQLAARVRAALDGPSVNLDSQVDLLRALRRAGIQVASTSRWELSEHEHPAIEPLIAYKKLARLQSANGWAWLDEWVHDGRFRPDYVPGGTATGRWATSGGGALQLPKSRAQRGGRRSRVDTRGRRRRAARTAGARRDGARRGHGCGRPWPRHLPRHRRRGRRRRPRPGEGRDPRCDVRRDDRRQRAARAPAGAGVSARDGARRSGGARPASAARS